MNNLNKVLVGVGLVLVLVVGLLAYGSGKNAGVVGMLGTSTSTYSVAGNRLMTYNFLVDVVDSLTGNRAPLAGLVSSSTVWNPAPLSEGEVATTSITGLGSSIELGDYCFFSLATSTQGNDSILTSCEVNATGTAVLLIKGATTTIDINATADVRAFDLDTFIAPAVLEVATSSTPNE
jgi:hypothetical protein